MQIDLAVKHAKMLLIEKIMAPRKPAVIAIDIEQSIYDQLYGSFPGC